MKFELSEAEAKRAKEWIAKHSEEEVIEYTGAIGGRWLYTFLPTSIGDLVWVRCSVCNAEEEISDMSREPGELFAAAKARAEKRRDEG